MNVGGIRTSMIADVGPLALATTSTSSVASATEATTSCPSSVSRCAEPLPQQDGVLGDHDPHGNSTVRTVGPPWG